MILNSWWKKIFKSREQECVCHDCTKNLSDALVKSPLRVECLKGEEGVCQRLREMGFCESAVVEKVVDSGTLICKVCETKVILSKDLAKNIMVKDVCPCHESTSMSENKSFPLSQLSIGQKGVIAGFAIETDGYERIEEMGVTRGEVVEIIRYAPLGDPIEIKIRGYCLSLRKQEADLIKVKINS